VGHFIAGEMLLLDTETDGKEADDAHLIENALVYVRPTQPRVEQVWLCQPTRPIPDEAVGVHEISTQRATTEGRPRAEVLEEILAALDPWDERCPLIGHNISYDLTVLDRNLGRELGIELDINGPVIDTFLLDKCCDQWRSGSRQLKETAEHYRVELVKAHSACADALAAGRIAWRMVNTKHWPYGRFGPSAREREARMMIAAGDAVALDRAQRRWFTASQLELAAYFRTPKAITAIQRKVREGRLTSEQGEAAIADLPAAADRVEASAENGWPLRPRVPVAT
jgi:DNA polymerase-3 subunit epsilon